MSAPYLRKFSCWFPPHYRAFRSASFRDVIHMEGYGTCSSCRPLMRVNVRIPASFVKVISTFFFGAAHSACACMPNGQGSLTSLETCEEQG
jgi:hypothetical protein